MEKVENPFELILKKLEDIEKKQQEIAQPLNELSGIRVKLEQLTQIKEEKLMSITECCMMLNISANHFAKHYRASLSNKSKGKHPRYLRSDIIKLMQEIKDKAQAA